MPDIVLTKDDLIKKFTVATLVFNNETSAFSYDFPIHKVFNTPEEVLDVIENTLDFAPSTWHTICPLYLPEQVSEEEDFGQCLHYDSIMKSAVLCTQNKDKEEPLAKVIGIEQVYRDNGEEFPNENFGSEIS